MVPSESGAQPEGWHQQKIQAAIRLKGTTIAQLSREHGLNRGTLQSVFYKRYPKGQAIIADFIGRSRHELWPHWYGPNDELLPTQGRLHMLGQEAA